MLYLDQISTQFIISGLTRHPIKLFVWHLCRTCRSNLLMKFKIQNGHSSKIDCHKKRLIIHYNHQNESNPHIKILKHFKIMFNYNHYYDMKMMDHKLCREWT